MKKKLKQAPRSPKAGCITLCTEEYAKYMQIYNDIQVECGNTRHKFEIQVLKVEVGCIHSVCSSRYRKRGQYTSCMHRYTTCVYKKREWISKSKNQHLWPNVSGL
uniref:Uncharacterized protein n=1 Tax=Solanum tuberosum TaxID=4113 RepID=M0ZPF1_SOLTU